MKLMIAFLTTLMFAFTTFAADVAYTIKAEQGLKNAVSVQWTGVASSSTPTAFKAANYVDHTIQVAGTFGGATIALHGSNDGVTYTQLTDQANAALTCTTTCLKSIQQPALYIKPVVSGGTTVNLKINLHSK